jgi:hypothetical protein
VALIDTDWRTLSFWPGDPSVTERIRQAWADSVENPAAGAQLLDLLDGAGFTDLAFETQVLVIGSRMAADRPPVPLMTANAVDLGLLSPDEAVEWLTLVRDASARGVFVATVTMAAASGKRA